MEDGTVVEMGASTCAHCGHITVIPPNSKAEDVGIAICFGCTRLICKGCVGKGCTPIEKWCEQQESRYYLEQAIANNSWDQGGATTPVRRAK